MCGIYDFVRLGNLESLKNYVLQYPPKPQVIDQCLYIAITRGHLHIVEYLITQWSADPHSNNDECVNIALELNYLEIAEYLKSIS
jgi:hypothetical protein